MNIPSKCLLALAAIVIFTTWQIARVTPSLSNAEIAWQKEEPTEAKNAQRTNTIRDNTSFLQLLLDERRPHCQAKFHNSIQQGDEEETPTVVTYLAVARAASEDLHAKLSSSSQQLQGEQRRTTTILNHHDHDCTLRDLEERGARRVLVAVRHPLARISSGISRRLERKVLKKKANAVFVEHFGTKKHNGGGGAEAFVGALRNQTDPLHEAALNATVGPRRQNYMVPVSEFYLANSLGLAEVKFLCIDTLDHDYAAAFQRWFPTNVNADDTGSPVKSPRNDKRKHVSKISSGNATTVFLRFSKESVDWIEQTYAKDIALYQKHCPEGYLKYTRTQIVVSSPSDQPRKSI